MPQMFSAAEEWAIQLCIADGNEHIMFISVYQVFYQFLQPSSTANKRR